MLKLVDIKTYYGNIQALKGINIEVTEGEIITLIGANGAGKTTALMSISGIVPPRTGEILFMGMELYSRRAFAIFKIGFTSIDSGTADSKITNYDL